MHFKFKLEKEADGELNIKIIVPCPSYAALLEVLTAAATGEVVQMSEKRVFPSSPSSLVLQSEHLRCASSLEEVSSGLQKVYSVLKVWSSLVLEGGRALNENAQTLLVQVRVQKPLPEDIKHLGFVLRKTNIDHHTLLFRLAKHMKVGTDAVSFYGMKDKHAVTTQFMCLRVLRKKLQPLVGKNSQSIYQIIAKRLSQLQIKGGTVETGNYCVLDTSLRIGDHYGNRFRIKLRFDEETDSNRSECSDNTNEEESSSSSNNNENHSDSNSDSSSGSNSDTKERKDLLEELLRQRCVLVDSRGVPNYYGLQRFGSELVGTFVLRREWIKAVNMLIASSSPAASLVAKGLKEYRKKQLREHTNESLSNERQPKKNVGVKEEEEEEREQETFTNDKESSVGTIRAETQEEAEFAYSTLPYKTRAFFTSQIQAFLFNHAISRRIEKFGNKVFERDIVSLGANRKESVVYVSDQASASIFEVLLPLPHTRFSLSNLAPEMRAIFEEVCRDYDLCWDHFSSDICANHVVLRSFLVRPQNLNVYSEDLDTITISFDLAKGAYATVILREILGRSPSDCWTTNKHLNENNSIQMSGLVEV